MAGSRESGLILQDRDRHLLRELGVMRLIDREHAKIVAGFGSTTRANTRLLALSRAGLLSRFFVGTIGGGRKAIYTLTARGAAQVGMEAGIRRKRGQTVVGDLFVEHQTHINSIYVAVKFGPMPSARVRRWISFNRPVSRAARLIPDGYTEIEASGETQCMFLEVDLGTEALRTWDRKVREYLQFAIGGDFERRFHGKRFRVLVIANSDKRLANIRERVTRATDKIFWFTTFESINRDGPWCPIWLRPRGNLRQSLLARSQ